MTDINARRAAAMRAHWLGRAVSPDRVRELHAAGLTDVEIGRRLRCHPSNVRRHRRILSLPSNTSSARRVQVASGALSAVARRANARARAAALALPLVHYSPLAVQIVTTLAAGPLTQPELAARLSVPHGHGSYLAKLCASLRRANVVASRSVYGGSTFRKPSVWALSPSTVAAAFSPDALLPLQQSLITTETLRTADVITSKYAVRAPACVRDDIESAARAGLVSAARKFDPTRFRFSTYLPHRLHGEIRDALRELLPKGYRRGYQRTVPAPVVSSDVSDVAAAPTALAVDDLDALDALTAPLGPQARTVLRLIFADGLSHRQIGDRLGVSESRVSQIYSGALAELRAQTLFP